MDILRCIFVKLSIAKEKDLPDSVTNPELVTKPELGVLITGVNNLGLSTDWGDSENLAISLLMILDNSPSACSDNIFSSEKYSPVIEGGD